MLTHLPSIPYPPSGEGLWSPVTSTLNWCEEDYYATVYSAEIVNSLTSLTFVYLAHKGISNCIRNGHDSVFLVAFTSYLIIGFGSFCFHSTLKYPMQLVDELSMIYTTCITFYAIFSHGQSKSNAILLFLFTVSLAVFITGYYHFLQNPVFHQNAFALLTAIVFIRSMYVMKANLRPYVQVKECTLHQPHAKSHASASDEVPSVEVEQARTGDRDAEILRKMWKMIACGLSVVLGGFFIWNLDNIFCPTLRRWRRGVGLPWGIVLEGHGWWHIMTGIAAYFNLTWGIWLRYCLNGKQDDVELVWPSLFTSVPVVVRRDKAKSQYGYENRLKKRN